MSAFIPNRRDPEVTERALEEVAADKRREASDGFDGTWVAHPDLIPTARAEFDAVLGDRPNQVDRLRDDVEVTAAQLLDIPSIGGEVTEAGVHDNVVDRDPLHRVVAARHGRGGHRQPHGGCRDRRDLALAGVAVDPRGTPSPPRARRIDQTSIVRIMAAAVAELPRFEGDRFDDAIAVFRSVALEPEFPTFLTVGAYARFF